MDTANLESALPKTRYNCGLYDPLMGGGWAPAFDLRAGKACSGWDCREDSWEGSIELERDGSMSFGSETVAYKELYSKGSGWKEYAKIFAPMLPVPDGSGVAHHADMQEGGEMHFVDDPFRPIEVGDYICYEKE